MVIAMNNIQIGGIIGGIGCLLIMIAMIVNNLSGYTGGVSYYHYQQIGITCKWDKVCSNYAMGECIEYSDSICNIYNCPKGAGQSWLAFSIIGLFIGVIGVILCFISFLKFIQPHIKWLFIASAICCAIANFIWIGENNNLELSQYNQQILKLGCYDTSLNSCYYGGSCILLWIAMIFQVISFGLTFKKPEDYENLLS